jgi:hypothetical protein
MVSARARADARVGSPRNSHVNLAPIALARLVKNVLECVAGKVRAEDVESGLRPGMHQGFRQSGAKGLGLLCLAAQRFRDGPDQLGIAPGRLNLGAHKPPCRRTTAVRPGRLALRFSGHGSDSGYSGYITGNLVKIKKPMWQDRCVSSRSPRDRAVERSRPLTTFAILTTC